MHTEFPQTGIFPPCGMHTRSCQNEADVSTSKSYIHVYINGVRKGLWTQYAESIRLIVETNFISKIKLFLLIVWYPHSTRFTLFGYDSEFFMELQPKLTLSMHNPLSANPTKWSNTLKQFVGNFPTNCLSMFDHFVGLALKGTLMKI